MSIRSLLFLLSISALFVFASCNEEDEPMQTPDIVELASSDNRFTTLVEALTQADLASTLQGAGPFTVFAPTNDAFSVLLTAIGASSLSDVDNTVLSEILLNHVISQNISSSTLSDGYVATNATGPGTTNVDLFVNGTTLNGSSNIIETDLTASNGTIHVIDEVLLQNSVVDLALDNQGLSSLVAALTRPDNTTDFVGTLSGPGPFTVFAPTNEAFQSLLDSNSEWNTLADIPQATLDVVLKYHVVNAGNVVAGDLVDGQSVTTLSGNMFAIDLDNGAQVITESGQTVNITATDIQGVNGVVHLVDTVLLP